MITGASLGVHLRRRVQLDGPPSAWKQSADRTGVYLITFQAMNTDGVVASDEVHDGDTLILSSDVTINLAKPIIAFLRANPMLRQFGMILDTTQIIDSDDEPTRPSCTIEVCRDFSLSQIPWLFKLYLEG